METKEKTWVDRELKVYNPCVSALKEARKYPDPQTAWDSWSSADELFWTLVRLRANTDRLILCCSEMIFPLLRAMRWEVDDDETMNGYEGAVQAVCEWAARPQTENRKAIDFYYDDVVGRNWSRPIARHGARAVEKLVLAVERPHKLIDLPDVVKSGVGNALEAGWNIPFVDGIANSDLTRKQYEKRQCDIVRNFFPITPFIKAYC